MADSLQESLERVLREYPAARAEPLKDHPLARFIRVELPEIFERGLKDRLGPNSYTVAGTKFIGSWAYVPWVSILDPRITDSNQRGIYLVCLFAEGGDRVVLAVGEGVTDTNLKALADDRQRILTAIAPPDGFQPGPASIGTLGQSSSAKNYEQGLICYKAYERGSIPSDDVLLTDVQGALGIVRQIADSPVLSSLSFSQLPADPVSQSITFRDVSITAADVRQAFESTTRADWEGRLGYDPYWMIEVNGERKPLKAVVRKINPKLEVAEFTTHEAARIVRGLGFQAINEREEKGGGHVKSDRAWLYAPGRDAERWSDVQQRGEMTIGWDELGDLSTYSTLDQITDALKKAYGTEGDPEPTNNARCNWEFSHVIQPGDLVYARRGRHQLIGVGEVTGTYRWDASRPDHRHVIPVKWQKVGNWRLPDGTVFNIKTLTNIAPYPEFVELLDELAGVGETQPLPAPVSEGPTGDLAPPYTLDMLATKTGHALLWLRSLISRLHRKKHLVLQGPPGTGKTFLVSTPK